MQSNFHRRIHEYADGFDIQIGLKIDQNTPEITQASYEGKYHGNT